VVFFEAEADQLDDIGRVIDFSVLKQKLGGWIDEHWDHGFILGEADSRARAVIGGMAGQKQYVMPLNPTAENMAGYLLHHVGPEALTGTGVRLVKVILWETENCYAVAELPR
jgi:6-pyruvoyltetrahydropterin/6-carboxytetrahydropterin synthase